RVELLDGVDQPEDAVADQVGLLDVLGQARGDPSGHVLHQRRVVEYEPVALLPVGPGAVGGPQLVDGVGGHQRGSWWCSGSGDVQNPRVSRLWGRLGTGMSLVEDPT